MQTNCRCFRHADSQRRLLKRFSMPGFGQIQRFFGLNQIDFVKFQGISGMAVAWSKIKGILKVIQNTVGIMNKYQNYKKKSEPVLIF